MLPIALVTLAALATAQTPQTRTIHSVCDLSQKFTFYMDGRFHRQYLKDVGRDVRNWGSLAKTDLSNCNLLVLTGGNRRIPYAPATIANIDKFVRGGGTLLLMIDGSKPPQPGTDVAEHFDATLTTTRARRPLERPRDVSADEVTFRGGSVLEVGEDWDIWIQDAKQRPVLASRRHDLGHVLIGSRGLFGQRPDASDPINAQWITPMLVELTSAKPIDPRAPHKTTWVEHQKQIGPLTLEYHDGTERFAADIVKEYDVVRPHLVEITGVEPSPGMIKRLLILPTGGGGFSSGQRIAIGAWWGNYPEKRYPMVELIAHEAGHSWVLPYAEPLWNEPIATWLGIQVGRRLGMEQADKTLARQIAAGRKHDPDYTQLNPMADNTPRDVIWGKSYFVFEELERRHGPGAMAKYFRTKRAALPPTRGATGKGYSMDDCVAVWSRAVGEDLFGWFRSLAFDVSAERTNLYPPAKTDR